MLVMESTKLRRWPYLATGVVIFIFMGILYAWSLFAGPLEAEFGWHRQETSMVYTTTMLMFGIGNIVGGLVSAKLSVKQYIYISAALFFAGFMLSSFATEIWMLVLTYGMMCGFAVGFSYTPIINAVTRWFPDKSGVASGILLMAYAMSTLLIGTPVARLFDMIGIAWTFRLMGIVFSLCIVLLVQRLKSPPEGTVFPAPKAKEGAASNVAAVDLQPKQVLRQPSFWLFFLWQVGIVTAAFGVIGQAATSAASIGASLVMATASASAFSISNGVGRLLSGMLSDRIGFVRVRYLACLVTLAGYAVSLVALKTESPVLLLISFVVVGTAFGATITNAAAFFRGMYGSKYFGANYGMSFLNNIPTSLIGTPIMAAIFTATGSYYPAFWAAAGMALFGSIMAFAIKKPQA
jgi:OFA family oxalate/formate antiporter-like MFS transporter